jgi:hypothetical protein
MQFSSNGRTRRPHGTPTPTPTHTHTSRNQSPTKADHRPKPITDRSRSGSKGGTKRFTPDPRPVHHQRPPTPEPHRRPPAPRPTRATTLKTSTAEPGTPIASGPNSVLANQPDPHHQLSATRPEDPARRHAPNTMCTHQPATARPVLLVNVPPVSNHQAHCRRLRWSA